MPDIDGTVAPGWEPVRSAFETNFSTHGDVGAACSVMLHGEPVVDLWGGLADRDSGRAWEQDTPVLVFSTSKGLAAVLVHRLAQSGRLDLDQAVGDVWPEFVVAGKQGVTVRHVLTHSAGLPCVEGDWTLDDVFAPGRMAAQLATQAPLWPPGQAAGYHARTFGWLVGEIVLRVTGESLGAHLRSTVAHPLGLDLWVGTPRDVQERAARVYSDPALDDPDTREMMQAFFAGDSLGGKVLSGPSGLFAYDDMWNEPDLLAAEMPSSNGVGTARALARFYAACLGEVDGVRLLSRLHLDAARAPQFVGDDAVLGTPARFATGFMLRPMLNPNAPLTAVGHPGAGGSVAFADPAAGLSFAYTPNQMKMGLTGDDRSAGLIEATYSCLRPSVP